MSSLFLLFHQWEALMKVPPPSFPNTLDGQLSALSSAWPFWLL